MAMVTVAAKELVTAAEVLADAVVTIEDGRIAGVRRRDDAGCGGIDYDLSNGTLTPGFLDIHFHGIAGQDVMNASPEGFREIARRLARAGVTRFLPTTVTASLDATLRALERMAACVETEPTPGEARAVGIHIEGPFLSHQKRGMHAAEHLLEPSPQTLDRLWEASGGQIRQMTIAPELPGALETIEHASELGIRCSMGHSMATKAEAIAGIQAGVVTATHTFNAMRPLDHQEPGILGVVLDRDDMYADLICDGYHVVREAVQLWLRCKGPERGILITDCLSAAGMPDGTYLAGETTVHVEGDTCRTDAGVLAGSVITLDQAVSNLRRVTGTGLATAVLMASRNPARMLGLEETLIVGSPADLNFYNSEGTRVGAMVGGVMVS